MLHVLLHEIFATTNFRVFQNRENLMMRENKVVYLLKEMIQKFSKFAKMLLINARN